MTSRPGDGGGVLWTLFRFELKRLLRDRRMILIAVVAPLVLFPVLILVMRAVEESEARRLDEAVYPYAIVGERADWGRALVARALALELENPDTTRRPARFEERPAEEADSALLAGDIQVLVVAEDSAVAGALGAGTGSLPVLRLRFRARSDFSRAAAQRLQDRLLEVRENMRDSALLAGGFPVDPSELAVVEPVNVASAERQAGALLGLALTPFLLFLMLSGGSIMAVDAISGEKERGTLETLLTTAAARHEIVRSKQLAIICVGVAVAVVNVLNLLLYLVVGIVELPTDFSVSLSILDLVLLLVLFVPLAVLVSSVLLLLSGYARSYKEYQIYFFPVFLAFLVPSLAGMLPGMELRSAIALVPVSGIGVAVREIMVGEYDWLFLPVAFASTALLAGWLARLTERTLSTERLISAADLDRAELLGGPALFPRRVLRWFGILWVAALLIGLWFGESLGIRGQLAVNLLGLFFVGSLLMVRQYRLDPVEAFALRLPHPAVWPAVLLGAPAAYLVGIGLAGLVNTYLFPVPQNVLEAFGESLTGDEIPLWQLVLFLTVMPGVFEELAFRGVLLHGLRRRLGPVATALAVGAVFGLFHVSLFRLIPTAYLGALFAAVVLLTRSIYPVMLWHALNNAIAFVPAYLGWVDESTQVPWWGWGAACVGLAVSLWMIWKVRVRVT